MRKYKLIYWLIIAPIFASIALYFVYKIGEDNENKMDARMDAFWKKNNKKNERYMDSMKRLQVEHLIRIEKAKK